MAAMGTSRPQVIALVAGLAVVVAGTVVAVRERMRTHGRPTSGAAAPSASSASAAGGPVLHVPHAPGAILLDGDTDDPGWITPPGPARTRDFLLPSGAPARPFSEIRFVWGDGFLYLALYAADEDIESRTTEADGPVWLDDAFRVVFTRGDTEYAIEVSPRAVITDSIRHGGTGRWDYTWSSGAHASTEMDGSLNEPSNLDEEWAIEMAVPFESLGLHGEPGERIGFTASRCDTPKGEARVCSAWGDKPLGALVMQ